LLLIHLKRGGYKGFSSSPSLLGADAAVAAAVPVPIEALS
jgi:hypothetical protein